MKIKIFIILYIAAVGSLLAQITPNAYQLTNDARTYTKLVPPNL